MCAECGMNPCHPRCPNAPEPVPVHECVKCGYGILAGDKFWDSPEGKICEECVDDMSAEEILKLCGESLTEMPLRKLCCRDAETTISDIVRGTGAM